MKIDVGDALRAVADRSVAMIKERDRDGWLALFAEDGVLEDPVGPSPTDPEGKGHRGRVAIAHFYDTAIAPNREIAFEIQRDFACGNELVRVCNMRIVREDGTRMTVPMVNCFRIVNGKLASLRAFWEPAQATIEAD